MIKSSSSISFHPHSASRGACLDGQAAGCPLRAAGAGHWQCHGLQGGQRAGGVPERGTPCPWHCPCLPELCRAQCWPLPAQPGALCHISSLSSSEIPALLKSDLGNSTHSQMLLSVPLQGFPAPMRKAGSCRALCSAE